MGKTTFIGGHIVFAFLFSLLSAFSPSCLFGQEGKNSSKSRFDLLEKQYDLLRKYIDSSENIFQELSKPTDLNRISVNNPSLQVLFLLTLGVYWNDFSIIADYIHSHRTFERRCY